MFCVSENNCIVIKRIIPIFSLTFFTAAFVFVFLSLNHYDIFSYASASKLVKDDIVIIIDPGHGGEDGGAVSTSGVMEKDINLQIAKFFRNYCSLSGLETVMTRNSDVLLTSESVGAVNKKRSDLKARVEIASKYDNAVFVSIHQNKFENSRYSGLQVFYSKNNPESAVLASIIKRNNKEMLDISNKREIKPSGREIYVLDNITSPAVLVECGFLSNSDEARKLSTTVYQKELAFMIYSALMEYLYNCDTGIN